MGKKELQSRENWQNLSGEKANNAENRFFLVFDRYFKNFLQDFQIISKPKELDNIYKNIALPQEVFIIHQVDMENTESRLITP